MILNETYQTTVRRGGCRPKTSYPLIVVGVSGQRFYGPEMGRWVNRDPIGETRRESLYEAMQNAPSFKMDSVEHSTVTVPKKSSKCCKYDELKALVDLWAAQIGTLPANCLESIECSDNCQPPGAAGVYEDPVICGGTTVSAGKIKICKLSANALKHELQHAKQCLPVPCQPGMPAANCRALVILEVQASACGSAGTGGPCDSPVTPAEKDACVEAVGQALIGTALNPFDGGCDHCKVHMVQTSAGWMLKPALLPIPDAVFDPSNCLIGTPSSPTPTP